MSEPTVEREIARLRAALRRALYGVALSVIAALVIGIGNVAYTNHVDEKRHAVAEQAERDRQVAAEQNRIIVCQVALGQAEALRDATSDVGQKAREAWQALAVRLNCS